MSVSRRKPHVNPKPYKVFPPGDFMQEEMDERGMKASEVAVRLGLTPEGFSQLLDGSMRIRAALAESLSAVFGTSASFWVNLDRSWRLGADES